MQATTDDTTDILATFDWPGAVPPPALGVPLLLHGDQGRPMGRVERTGARSITVRVKAVAAEGFTLLRHRLSQRLALLQTRAGEIVALSLVSVATDPQAPRLTKLDYVPAAPFIAKTATTATKAAPLSRSRRRAQALVRARKALGPPPPALAREIVLADGTPVLRG